MKRGVIYYEEDCSFCKKWCNRFKKYLYLKDVDVCPIPPSGSIYEIFKKDYSWVVFDAVNAKYYTKSSAFWRLIFMAPFPIKLLFLVSYLPFVIFVGDKVYDFVAKHRPKTCLV